MRNSNDAKFHINIKEMIIIVILSVIALFIYSECLHSDVQLLSIIGVFITDATYILDIITKSHLKKSNYFNSTRFYIKAFLIDLYSFLLSLLIFSKPVYWLANKILPLNSNMSLSHIIYEMIIGNVHYVANIPNIIMAPAFSLITILVISVVIMLLIMAAINYYIINPKNNRKLNIKIRKFLNIYSK